MAGLLLSSGVRNVAIEFLKRTHAIAGQFHVHAGARGDILPGIALVVDAGGTGTGGAGAGGTVILAGERNAVALLVLLRLGRHGGPGEGESNSGGKAGIGEIAIHGSLPLVGWLGLIAHECQFASGSKVLRRKAVYTGL